MAKQKQEVTDAIELSAGITSALADVLDRVKDEHSDFFVSVATRAASIIKTVKDTNRCTPKQYQALDNMLVAVRKWLHEDDDD